MTGDSQPEKTVRIFIVGEAGDGIHTLTSNLFGAAIPWLNQKNVATEDNRQGILFKVYPLPINSVSEIRGMAHALNSLDVLVYCISVHPYLRNMAQRAITKSLQDEFGKKIWKQCLVAFTFSNGVWDSIYRRTSNNVVAVAQYKQHINYSATRFQKELNCLNMENFTVKTLFGFSPTQEDETTIVAIPAGLESDNPVLPDTKRHCVMNWRELFMVEIVRKCSSDLLYYYSPEVAAIIAGEDIMSVKFTSV